MNDNSGLPEGDALDAARWRALRPHLVGADFRWGDPEMSVVCFALPHSVRVGADADEIADQYVTLAAHATGDPSVSPPQHQEGNK